MIASVAEVLFAAITNYLAVGLAERGDAQLILDTVMLANAKDYPTTLLPGATINAPNPELLKTVGMRGNEDADRHAQRRRGVCAAELSDEDPLAA